MKEKVVRFISEKKLLHHGATVLIGVSGGPDSMALLHLLQQLAPAWNLSLSVIFVDHQLRKEAFDEARYVESYCNKVDIPFYLERVDVNRYQRIHKVSTQVAAREVRYAVFERYMNHLQADYLALGHHGDDQIETLLMSLIRTTSLSSLTGIPLRRSFSKGEIIRPLLCVTKSEIEDYCRINELNPRQDASNKDTTYTRNAIRTYVIPELKRFNARLHTTMQRLSETLAEDERYLMNEATRIVKETVTWNKQQKTAIIHTPRFIEYPNPLQRRAYRLIIDFLYEHLPNTLTHTHEESFLNVVQKEGNRAIHFPDRLVIERSYDRVFCYFQEEKKFTQYFHKIIDELPAQIHLPNGDHLTISLEKTLPQDANRNTYTFALTKGEVTFPLHVRTRQPGDKMTYKGLKGTKKIKDILIDEKVPRNKRDETYLLVDDAGTILWLIGLRKAETVQKKESPYYIICTYEKKKEIDC